jgi:hypothetical protein
MRVRLGRAGHTGRSATTPYRTPRAYDLLDAPAAAGHRVLLQLERLGAPLGPVLAVSGGRLQFFVEAGSTASFSADLAELGWEPTGLDIRPVSTVIAADAVLPPVGSARWVRPPDAERAAAYPPAHLLLGSLAYACRHPALVPTQASHRKAA